jgi:hypothetical protein
MILAIVEFAALLATLTVPTVVAGREGVVCLFSTVLLILYSPFLAVTKKGSAQSFI